MSQLQVMWDNLDGRSRLVAGLAALAIVLAFLWLVRIVNTPTMALLYSGLDNATAGEIVSALEARKIPFDVRGNAIYVAAGERDQARLSLASEGLPANGNAGYELLDGLSGFGTTAQMFDAAYWRAKEGELARTIVATRNVRTARVHISNPVNRPFSRDTSASASVIVTMASGALDTTQAKAMRFLVASAVAGLTPDDVSVIDSVAGIVLAAGAEPEQSALDDSQARAETMRANIERLLAARVGAGKAIVEVHVDADMDMETITERVLDPNGKVAISSDTEEVTSSSNGTGAGGVTVASNLPDGDVAPQGESSQANNAQTRETVNYDVSEVRRERVKHPGEIRRLSVAVLVDGVTTVDAAGAEAWAPRSPEELASLRELVQSAVGFDAARGDVVTIESLQFSTPVADGTLAEAGALDGLMMNLAALIQMVILAVVAVVLGLFVLRPLIVGAGGRGATTLPPPDPADLQAAAAVAPPVAEIELNPEVLGDPAPVDDSLGRLKSAITDRSSESSNVLEDWLNAPEAEPERA